jgi:hypothetical protein
VFHLRYPGESTTDMSEVVELEVWREVAEEAAWLEDEN